jgi:hypothetical protein
MKSFLSRLLVYHIIVVPTLLYALPAQVVIIRHGEKDPVTRGLTQQGQERAAALAYYLTQTDYLLNFGPPAALFASRSVPISDRLVPRTIETIMPTGELLRLPIHSPFNGYQVNYMADFILYSGKYDGKNIVICWNHSSIHDLLNAFGYQAPFSCTTPNNKYPDCRFDLTFVLTFPAPAPVSGQLPYATVFFQQLLFGDLTCQSSCNPPNLPASACYFNSPASPLAVQVCSTICPTVGLGDD